MTSTQSSPNKVGLTNSGTFSFLNRMGERKLLLVLVGLPARGKSYIAKRLKRWLNWSGLNCEVFNVGNYRRQKTTDSKSDFFDHTDKEKENLRHKLAMDVLEDCIEYVHSKGDVAIHDATNTTDERRNKILERMRTEPKIQLVFVESICTDPEVLKANIQMKQKSPDYKDMNPEDATRDFLARLTNYEAVYREIPEDSPLSYVKVINVGRRVIANEISGVISSQIVVYLMNMHIFPRTIWMCRHGQSEDNLTDKVGGDSNLTKRGQAFAEALNQFIRSKAKPTELEIWTSTLRRAIETSQPLMYDYKVIRNGLLNEIDGGMCEGLSYAEIEQKYPDIAKQRDQNKLTFRYPGGGESYVDLIERLKPIIIELERVKYSVLLISHRAVVRTLLAYFQEISLEELPHIDMPLNQVIRLQPTAYGVVMEKFDLTPQVEAILYEQNEIAKRQKVQ